MITALALLQQEYARAQKQAQQLAAAVAALKGGPTASPKRTKAAKAKQPKRRGPISPEGLKRIKAAQKARWAKFHQQQAGV